jgi:hypothetical protein
VKHCWHWHNIDGGHWKQGHHLICHYCKKIVKLTEASKGHLDDLGHCESTEALK